MKSLEERDFLCQSKATGSVGKLTLFSKRAEGCLFYCEVDDMVFNKKEWIKNNKDLICKWEKDYLVRNPWKSSYSNARQRCTNPKAMGYHLYGGKGIQFLMTMSDFEKLWNRDHAFSLKQPSIDRINPEGNYEYSNCRFIEMSEDGKRSRKRAVPVVQYSIDGDVVRVWYRAAQVQCKLGISSRSINNCAKGRSKTAGGFVWRYLAKNKYTVKGAS